MYYASRQWFWSPIGSLHVLGKKRKMKKLQLLNWTFSFRKRFSTEKLKTVWLHISQYVANSLKIKVFRRLKIDLYWCWRWVSKTWQQVSLLLLNTSALDSLCRLAHRQCLLTSFWPTISSCGSGNSIANITEAFKCRFCYKITCLNTY